MTSLDHDKSTLLTLRLHRVLRRQANVRFSLGTVTNIVVPESVGPVLEREQVDLLMPFAVPAGNVLNVFSVSRIAEDIKPVRVPTGPDAPAIAVLPDRDCPDGMDLMRGPTRRFGYPLVDADSGLMAPCVSGTDRRWVSRAVADHVDPTSEA